MPSARPVELRVPGDLAAVRGRVTDPEGRPVPGATAVAIVEPGFRERLETTAVSAADGSFELAILPTGVVEVAAPAFQGARVAVQDPRATLEVELHRLGRLRVRTVVHGTGSAVAGVPVSGRLLESLPGLPVPRPGRDLRTIGTTGSDGTFEVDLPPGSWRVRAAGAGWVSGPGTSGDEASTVVIHRRVLREIVIPVRPAARLEGRVTRISGEAAAGAEVRATLAEDGERPIWALGEEVVGSAIADGDGRYVLDGLEAGRAVRIVASLALARGRPSEPVVPLLAGGPSQDVDLPMVRPLAVRVLDGEGKPVPGARVGWSGWGPATGPDGIARLGDLPLDRYPIEVEPIGALSATVVAVDLRSAPKEGALVEVRIPESLSCEGRVTLPDGSPCSRAWVGVKGPIVAGRLLPSGWQSAAVRSDGSFVVSGLSGGRWRLRAAVPRSGATWEGEIEADAGARDLTIAVAPSEHSAPESKRLEIRVVDPEGRPVPRARGRYWSHEGGIRELEVDAGRCLTEAMAGSGRVRVWDARDEQAEPLPLGPAEVEGVEEGAGSLEVRMPREAVIAGRVVGPDGRGHEGVVVAARVPGPDESLPFHVPDAAVTTVRTGPDGTFRLGRLAARPYDVEVVPSSGWLPQTVSDVSAGRTDVEIRLRRTGTVVVTVLDPHGTPVRGAEVQVTAERAPETEKASAPLPPWSGWAPDPVTQEDGRVAFERLDPRARHRLEVRPPADREDLLSTVVEGWIPREESVRLVEALSVSGVVEAPCGRPVSWVHVRATDVSGRTSYDTTGEDGAFSCGGLRAGSVTIEADLYGVPDAGGEPDARLATGAGTHGIRLLVDPGPVLRIRVSGNAVPRDAHEVHQSAVYLRAGDDWQRHSADFVDGALEFRRVRAGAPWILWIPWSKETKGTLLATGTNLDLRPREVTLDAGLEIRGTAPVRTHPRGSWATSGPSPVWVVAERGPVRVRGWLHDNGEFGFPPLPEGRWKVRLQAFDDESRLVGGAAEVDAGDGVRIDPKPIDRSRPRQD